MPDLFGWYTPPAASASLGGAGINLLEDPSQIRSYHKVLRNAGLWNPAWDSWLNWQPATGDSSGQAEPPMPDFSSLAGFRVDDQQVDGDNHIAYLRGPDGQIRAEDRYVYDNSSLGRGLIEGGLIVGGAALGMNALFGGLGGAAVGSGVGTLPSTIGESLGTVGGLSEVGAATMPTIGEVAAVGGGTAAGASALPAGAAAGIGTLPATVGETLGTVASLATNAQAGISTMAGGSTIWDTILSGLSKGGVARSIFDIGSGLYGMSLARDAAKASDPFAQYRGFYGQQLQALEANPSSITSRPGWRAGLEGVDRQMAARGYYGSGNMDAARTRYAGDFYQQESARLAQLAGAGQTPGAGQFPAAQLTGQGLASIGYGLAPWIGGRQP